VSLRTGAVLHGAPSTLHFLVGVVKLAAACMNYDETNEPHVNRDCLLAQSIEFLRISCPETMFNKVEWNTMTDA